MEPLVDSHCHIHDSAYGFLAEEVLKEAARQRIAAMICVGTDGRSSREALGFCQDRPACWASLGLHPHLAVQASAELDAAFRALAELAGERRADRRLVAIGECGLDYFYHKDPAIRRRQSRLFVRQLELAAELDLPLIFHIRDAWDDFWPLYERCRLPAVLHSFSASAEQVTRGLAHPELYFGLNGIMTFTKDESQLAAARLIPADRLLLETDAPYLTPPPHRGKPNKPEYLRLILNFLARLRGEKAEELARQTSLNAGRLFGIDL